MIALTNAIYTAFSTNGTLTAAFPGGMSPDRLPETATMPYLVYQVSPPATNTCYGNKHRDDILVRFIALGIGMVATGIALETFDGIFSDHILTLATGQNYDCRRTQAPTPLMKEGVDGSGQEVWSWTCQYVYSVYK